MSDKEKEMESAVSENEKAENEDHYGEYERRHGQD